MYFLAVRAAASSASSSKEWSSVKSERKSNTWEERGCVGGEGRVCGGREGVCVCVCVKHGTRGQKELT